MSKKPLTMTSLDGTTLIAGDKCRVRIPLNGRYRVCKILELFKGGGVDRAMVTTTHAPFVTGIVGRYAVRRLPPPLQNNQEYGQ